METVNDPNLIQPSTPAPDAPVDTTDEIEVAIAPKYQPDPEDVAPTPQAKPAAPYEETVIGSTIVDALEPQRPVKPTDRTADMPPLRILYGTLEDTVNVLNAQVDSEIKDPENYNTWSEVVEDCYSNYYRGLTNRKPFEATVSDPGRVWAPNVEAAGTKLGPRRLNLPNTDGNVLRGGVAMNRVAKAMGMGMIVQVPLWHSGFWVSIKAPGDVELYELERRIANEKISLGRMTKGLVYSNTSVYVASHLINFILENVYSSSLPVDSIDQMKKSIKVSDVPTLIWGMLSSIYPNGYPYQQPCMSDLTKCNHIVSAMLDIGKLLWVDRSSLSEFQTKHMINRNSRMALDQIERYQSEFNHASKYSNIQLNDMMSVELDVPNIELYENTGYAWVEGIVRATDEAFGDKLVGQERDNYISDVARTTATRQYSHWVKRINVTDERGVTSPIEDREDIEANLYQISSDERMRRHFVDSVCGFIDDVTVAVIGYVNYACPKCGELQMKANGPKSRIIPLDMMSVFLTLQRHKIDLALKDQDSI